MHKALRGWLVGLSMMVGVLGVTQLGTARAQGGFPEYVDLYMNDFAGIMTAEDTVQVTALFTDLYATQGIEAVAVTIGSIHDYGTGDPDLATFATNLFNTWGVGDAVRNDGVLIIVAVRDREVQIRAGDGYAPDIDAAIQEVVNEHMLPHFRNEQYSRGIGQGARGLYHALTGLWPDEVAPGMDAGYDAPAPVTYPAPVSTYQPETGPNPLLYLFGAGGAAGAVGVAGWGIRRYRRYRPRACAECGAMMERLSETGDDVYLDSGQKLEEYLHSVDYDVWRCPECNAHTLHIYRSWMTTFQRCPECNYRTLEMHSRTVRAATYTSTGQKCITHNCRHCKHHSEQMVTIPRLQRTDTAGGGTRGSGFSSGGSSRRSFGGGHSSKRGGGGKW